MKIVGCDLHARQQTIAMVDTETGEFVERTLSHEGNALREFYAALEGPVVLGIEATGSMQWFLELLRELGIQCRVGHPAKIRAKETRSDKCLLMKILYSISHFQFTAAKSQTAAQAGSRVPLPDPERKFLWTARRLSPHHSNWSREAKSSGG